MLNQLQSTYNKTNQLFFFTKTIKTLHKELHKNSQLKQKSSFKKFK